MVVKRMKVYCPKCDKHDEADILLSWNTFRPVDPELIQRLLNNINCPVCGTEREIVN